jgi:hypothetical protein
MNELDELRAEIDWLRTQYLKALENIDILVAMVERADK